MLDRAAWFRYGVFNSSTPNSKTPEVMILVTVIFLETDTDFHSVVNQQTMLLIVFDTLFV